MKKNYKYLIPVLAILLGSNCVSAQTTTFAGTGTIATYTVPAGVTLISITAKGAQGSQGIGAGGLGAIITGTFTATPGHILKVLVGEQVPPTTLHYAGGGGGGSFVWDVTAGNVLLVAAGGGGGGGYTGVTAGQNAVITPDGTNGGGGAAYGGAGTGGNGGVAPTSAKHGAGGAGWLTNGAPGISAGCVAAGGGVKPLTSGAGGVFGGIAADDGAGGFGGGGGAQGTCAFGYGGGGGGYSGGGGGAGPAAALSGGGGGGSFNGGAPQANSVGNTGNGSVSITQICVPPTGGAIVAPPFLCVGASTTATNPTATPGGAWTSSNTAIATIDGTFGIISGIAPGVDTITYTVTLACGSATATRAITINPLPAPITGYSDLCPGSDMPLFDSTPGGTWSSIATSIATVGGTTGIVHGVAAGSTTISYTLAATGCASSRIVNVVSISGTTYTVCASDSITLTASSPVGTWSSSDATKATVNATTGVVTGVGLGTVVIGYTLPSGCTLLQPVTVNALAPIVGIDSVCVGGSRYLTDIVGGGMWSSDAPAAATVTFDSGRVFGVMAGTANITYTLPDGCFSFVAVHVIDLPPAIAGGMTLCPGITSALGDGVAGGIWTSGNPRVATIDAATGVDTGVSPGTVAMFYTISPGCTISTTVTVNPLPAPITGSRVICPGNKDTLYDATPFGVWSTTTPTISSVDTLGVVTSLLTGGTAVIRYTLPATGCYASAFVTVDHYPAPGLLYDYLIGTLFADTGYATYQWFDSSHGRILGATSHTVALTATDYYYVVVTDANGCSGRSAAFYYNLSFVGVSNTVTGGKVRIYPNPANNVVFIESAVKVNAVITGLDGRTELTRPDAHEIDISHLANGMYLLSLYDEHGTRLTVQKLTKE